MRQTGQATRQRPLCSVGTWQIQRQRPIYFGGPLENEHLDRISLPDTPVFLIASPHSRTVGAGNAGAAAEVTDSGPRTREREEARRRSIHCGCAVHDPRRAAHRAPGTTTSLRPRLAGPAKVLRQQLRLSSPNFHRALIIHSFFCLGPEPSASLLRPPPASPRPARPFHARKVCL